MIKAPSSNSKGSVNSDLLITIFISFDVRISGDINSLIPRLSNCKSFSFISSGLEILAIVFFAPNLLAKKQVKRLTDSDAVTPTNKSQSETLDFLRVEIDVQSP